MVVAKYVQEVKPELVIHAGNVWANRQRTSKDTSDGIAALAALGEICPVMVVQGFLDDLAGISVPDVTCNHVAISVGQLTLIPYMLGRPDTYRMRKETEYILSQLVPALHWDLNNKSRGPHILVSHGAPTWAVTHGECPKLKWAWGSEYNVCIVGGIPIPQAAGNTTIPGSLTNDYGETHPRGVWQIEDDCTASFVPLPLEQLTARDAIADIEA